LSVSLKERTRRRRGDEESKNPEDMEYMDGEERENRILYM